MENGDFLGQNISTFDEEENIVGCKFCIECTGCLLTDEDK